MFVHTIGTRCGLFSMARANHSFLHDTGFSNATAILHTQLLLNQTHNHASEAIKGCVNGRETWENLTDISALPFIS